MKKVVMTVDDSRTMRLFIRSALISKGYEVVEANDGQDALVKLGLGPVDMVITDYDMPKMNGIELVKKMKSDLTLRKTPVVILSSKQPKVEALSSGAALWIEKPFMPDKLIEIARRLIGEPLKAQPTPARA